MLNEYSYVLIEVLLALICGIISSFYLRKSQTKILSWKELGIYLIQILGLLVITIIFVIEFYEKETILLRYFIIIISTLFCVVCILLLFNFIFGIFLTRKHSKIHFILNFVEYMSSINIKRVFEIHSILEACFIYTSTFSIGSMMLSFITSYLFKENNILHEIYLLEVGPHFILFFMVLSLACWWVLLLVTLIYHKCCKVHLQDEHEEKIIEGINEKKKIMKW